MSARKALFNSFGLVGTPQGVTRLVSDYGNSIYGTSDGVHYIIDGFSPLDLSPIFWLDASDNTTITQIGGEVSAWKDKINNGYTFTSDGTTPPTVGITTQNSLGVMDFGGAAKMKCTSVTLPASGNLAVFAVAKITTVDQTDDGLFSFDDNTAGGSFALDAGNSTLWRSRLNYDIDTKIAFDSSDLSGTWRIFGAVLNFTENELFPTVNGVSGTTGLYDVKLATDSLVRIFAKLGGTAMPAGHIAEMVAVETTDCNCLGTLQSYLSNKWNLGCCP